MKIGIAGPVSLKMLASYVNEGRNLPTGYRFAPMAIWVEELLRRGHQISLFTLAPGISQPMSFTGDNLTINIGRYRAHARARDFFKQEIHDLKNAMRNDPVDVLHAHWTYEFALAALSSGYPVLVTAHDAPWKILRFYLHPYRVIRLIMAYQVCNRAPVISVVSPYLARHYRNCMRYHGRIEIIPNSVPNILFEKPIRTNNSGRIIFASNLIGWGKMKNGQVLIKAFSILHQQYPNSELWMFGEGHGHGQAAQQWAENHHCTESIQFRGQVPYFTLFNELSDNVDVLVHPALEESFSMAVAETMALGIPVIGGKSSGAVPDTLGKGGLLVNVRKPQEIADAMIRLAKDPALRAELGKTGREKAKQVYSLDQVISQYEHLYHQLLSNNKEKYR